MRRAKGRKGFTLIELVAALGILAIVAIPLTRLFMDSFKYQAKSQKNGEIAKVAEYVAEKFKNGEIVGLAGTLAKNMSTVNYISSMAGSDLPTTNEYTVKIIIEDEIFESAEDLGKISDEEVDITTIELDTSSITSATNISVGEVNYNNNTATIDIAAEFTGKLLIKNLEASEWTLTINNQKTKKVNVYTQRVDASGKISIISAPDKPSVIIYDLGKKSETADLQYAVYDVVIGVKRGKYIEEMEDSKNWEYTLRTTIKREKTV